MKNFLKKLLGVAPILASGLGGPLAGTVIGVLSDVLGVDKNSPSVEEELVKKLETATAEDWLKIKQAEQTFLLEMHKLGLGEEDIHRMDRDSARQRQVALNDRTPNILAYLIFGSFMAVLIGEFYLLFREIEVNPQALRLVDVTLGMLLVLVTGVKNYFFGSSRGSKEKTALLTNGK